MRQADLLSALLALLFYQAGQDAVRKPIVGTVSGFRTESGEIQVAPERGETTWVKLGAATEFQKIAPGEKDLKNAATIRVTDISVGDRVLVSFVADQEKARRIVVMPASDIAERNEAERQDWARRGTTGIVAGVRGNVITLRQTRTTVTVDEKTVIRRYAPDSVRFADAQKSALSDVRPGDQLRARGGEIAEEIVFGTFRTAAGPVLSIDAGAGEFTITDQVTGRPLAIKLAVDSQIKRLTGPPPYPSQVFEGLPSARLEDLRVGQTVAVSSTKGARSGQVTAIMVVADADMLLQQRTDSRPNFGAVGVGGMNGMSGLELPGLIP